MKRIVLALMATLAAATWLGCSTVAGSSAEATSSRPVLDRIERSGILRVGVSGSQPPFNAVSKSGEIIGMEADLANSLARTLAVRAEFVKLPFSELLRALDRGEVDIVMSGMTMTPERNMRAAFAGPYFISGKAILTRSETLARADEAADINEADIKLTALAGSTSNAFVTSAVPKAQFLPAKDYDEAVEMVFSGKADALVADYPICVLTVLRNPGSGLTTVVSPFTFEPLGAALPADDPLFANLVQNYMNSLEGTGLMDELRAKWFLDGSWVQQLP